MTRFFPWDWPVRRAAEHLGRRLENSRADVLAVWAGWEQR